MAGLLRAKHTRAEVLGFPEEKPYACIKLEFSLTQHGDMIVSFAFRLPQDPVTQLRS